MKSLDNLILGAFVFLAALSMTQCSPAAAQDTFTTEETALLHGALAEWVAQQEHPVVIVDVPQGDEIGWDDATRLALGQCLVAEVAWRSRTEQSAIAHVLERRWRMIAARQPGYRFEQMIRQYCHVHRDQHHVTDRMRWIRNLPWGPMITDPGMHQVDWDRFADDWDYVRETVELFEQRRLRDPIPLAMHWGGRLDHLATQGGAVWLGPTTHSIEDGARVLLSNRFYTLPSMLSRAALARLGR